MGSDEKQSLPGKSLADALGKQLQDEDDLFGFSKQLDPVALSTDTWKVAAQYISSVLPSSKLSVWLASQSLHGQSVARMGPGLNSASATDNSVRK